MQVQTRDLWESAYLLSEGGNLTDITVDYTRGRKEVIFVVNVYGMDGFIKEFQLGHAVCNVVKLRQCMNHLRDVMYKHIKR